MERRVYAAFKAQWPELDITVTSPKLTFDEYCNYEMGMEKVIHIIVGDLYRIIEYPKLGFQIEQDIPDDVMKSYRSLQQAGYTEFIPD
jgi:hypothetical protein